MDNALCAVEDHAIEILRKAVAGLDEFAQYNIAEIERLEQAIAGLKTRIADRADRRAIIAAALEKLKA